MYVSWKVKMQIRKINNKIQFTSKMTYLDFDDIKKLGKEISEKLGEKAGVECINNITNSLHPLKQLGDDTVEFSFATCVNDFYLLCKKDGEDLTGKTIKITEVLTEKIIAMGEEFIEEIKKMEACKKDKFIDPLDLAMDRLKRTFDRVFG